IDNDKSYVFSEDGTPGPICTELYHKLRAIQYGDEEDKYGWITFID
ncbi:MAG: branched chain amino acid aminotransferase, partial [Bacteroidales bacterium]|nr:branched chain amino acid aminotransferase [Bacteroidales bacterium]